LVAVTITRSVWATSADVSPLVEPVAPPIAAQAAPVVSQRSHWYANLRPFPCQVPVLEENVFGTRATPLTEGGVRFLGGCCPGEFAPPEAIPVARTRVSAEATAVVMRRLITSLPSGGIDFLVTPKRGRCGPILLFFSLIYAVL
jgi:hypothetical protein